MQMGKAAARAWPMGHFGAGVEMILVNSVTARQPTGQALFKSSLSVIRSQKSRSQVVMGVH
jgi:hypothetical protein